MQCCRCFLQQAHEPSGARQYLLTADHAQGGTPLVGEDVEAQRLAREQAQQDDEHELTGEAARPQASHGSTTAAVKL